MSQQLRALLERLRGLSGAEVAAVVSTDGLLIETASRTDLDVEAVAAVASNALVMAEAMGREIRKGGARQTILEYENGVVLMEPLGEEAMLLLVGQAPQALGRLRFSARSLLDALQEAVDAI